MRLPSPQLKNKSGYITALWPAGRPLQGVKRGVQGSTKAFTLIELVVVMAIIAVLMAMLLPVVSEAFNSGKKKRAREEVGAVQTAIELYSSTYGKLPGTGSSSSTDIIKALIAEDSAVNPRKIEFLDKDDVDITGTFEDPWGQQYEIILDDNYDNAITHDGNTYKVISIVWSKGSDGAAGGGDDIYSLD